MVHLFPNEVLPLPEELNSSVQPFMHEKVHTTIQVLVTAVKMSLPPMKRTTTPDQCVDTKIGHNFGYQPRGLSKFKEAVAVKLDVAAIDP